MGVKTITLTENKGQLAGALVVREHQELVFISQNGMVQRTSVRGINRYGRSSQGVRVMNIREDDQVSAVALVAESETSTAAPVADDLADDQPVDLLSPDAPVLPLDGAEAGDAPGEVDANADDELGQTDAGAAAEPGDEPGEIDADAGDASGDE
jgi:DNA gyrase subunit A